MTATEFSALVDTVQGLDRSNLTWMLGYLEATIGAEALAAIVANADAR